ncbi:ribbon-helix-helix domain-containing protein [Vulcanisaeta distributa]|uniref:ribbon-helix-helix domain-containing protein n=1 Tax=Vulcanisaeta distributa TaxID=164451 RepID=UPI0006D0C749|nr:ribbon-helix-helix domain-containing protein [Vulcanisaeta distributa]
MRFRSVRVREDVYELLTRLSEAGNTSISELIRQLITAYLAINEIREMLRQCLSQSGISVNNRVVNTESIRDSIREAPKELINEPLINLEDNPWVQIIRSRVAGNEN